MVYLIRNLRNIQMKYKIFNVSNVTIPLTTLVELKRAKKHLTVLDDLHGHLSEWKKFIPKRFIPNSHVATGHLTDVTNANFDI